MRAQPLWRLLASANGPTVIGLLQSLLYDAERVLPASIFHERIEKDLETLRARGEDFPQSAQAYAAAWLAEGFLERRFPPGASEEEYELSTAAVEAIRFVAGVARPHAAATESRLSLVIKALVGLAEDTDADQLKRIDRLEAERARIEQEIEAIRQGRLHVLSDAAALERTREVVSLADDLTSDFRRVRDQFEQLNRELRERLMDDEGSRGEVLHSLFAGIDLIAESEAGRTFAAFWRLLTDPEQAAVLDEALDGVLSRSFVTQLDSQDRRFLLRLTRSLLQQGGSVHEVLQAFARSLKNFVQSREYLEQRRLNQVLKEAQRAALLLKDEVRASDGLEYTLQLTSSRVRSVSQWVLFDPSQQAVPDTMRPGDPLAIDLSAVGELVSQSEIDFRSLKEHVRDVLAHQAQASIGEVLARHPAAQGLGSVLGLIALGSRHGNRSQASETVFWTGGDAQDRSARIPTIYFSRERLRELA